MPPGRFGQSPLTPREHPMQTYRFDDIEGMQSLVSESFGDWSSEVEITQELINAFAELTGDHYWIHTDPERARSQNPFGRTIAHGFLTLVLMPKMRSTPTWEVTGYNNILNYGSDKLRFSGAVPAGSSIRSRNRVKAVSKEPKGTKLTLETHIHVVGQERPALVYDLMLIYM
jgi:acyl dehydratase